MIFSSFQVSTQYLSYISWAPPKVKFFMWLLLHMDHGWLLQTADRSEHLHGPPKPTSNGTSVLRAIC